jgi:hypothetical protein
LAWDTEKVRFCLAAVVEQYGTAAVCLPFELVQQCESVGLYRIKLTMDYLCSGSERRIGT